MDILMSLREGATRVGLPCYAVAACVTHMIVTEAKVRLSGSTAACLLLCSGIWRDAPEGKPRSVPSPQT